MLKNILVAGGAGYIGSHTCKALAQAGYRPVTVDNLVYGHRSAVRWGPLVQADLADRSAIHKVIRDYDIEAVMHFAAYAYVGESMRQPGKYFQNNVANTFQLFEVMREAGLKTIIFSSTCATYGHPDYLPIDEAHAQQPVNPYGESKLFVERTLPWYGMAHGFDYAVLRYFNAAGADPDGEIGEQHDPETHLIPLVIEAALGRRASVEIYGTDYPTQDGTAIRDYTHVSDLADAHVLALDYLQQGNQSICLNLGTGKGYSVREVIAAVERIGRCAVPIKQTRRRPGDPTELVADASRAREVLAWTPSRSDIDTIVQTAWDWSKRSPTSSETTVLHAVS